MLSDISMTVGSKLPYEHLRIKFDIRQINLLFHELLPHVYILFSSLFFIRIFGYI